MKTRQQALKLGKNLLKQMKGRGWKLRIWDNIGYHYSVYSGPVSVHPSGGADATDLKFFCLISDELDNVSGGLANWTSPGGYYKDPNYAVSKAVELMTEVVDRYLKVKDAALNAMKSEPTFALSKV